MREVTHLHQCHIVLPFILVPEEVGEATTMV